jgi:hypothetical protein
MQIFRLISSGGSYSLTALSWTASRSSPSQFQLDLREHRIAIDMYASRRARFSPFQIAKDSAEDQQISGSASARCQKNTEPHFGWSAQ